MVQIERSWDGMAGEQHGIGFPDGAFTVSVNGRRAYQTPNERDNDLFAAQLLVYAELLKEGNKCKGD